MGLCKEKFGSDNTCMAKVAKIIVRGAGERQSEADITAEMAKGSGRTL